MRLSFAILAVLAVLGGMLAAEYAAAQSPQCARACRNGCAWHGGARARGAGNGDSYPWHGYYYDTSYGLPVALVVPPTAENQTHWGWGVGNTRITPIYPQFQLVPPGPGPYGRTGFQPTPGQPTDTDQFGVYYVRGPW